MTEVGREAVARKARPWRIVPDDFFEESERLRLAFAELIGGSAEEVALQPAASYGLSWAAQVLPLRAGQRVVLLADQFPSNVYPWRARAQEVGADVVSVPRPAEGGFTEGVVAAIDERTGVVALPQVHWTDGSRIDLVTVGRRCRDVGAALALDLTQSLGAMPFDLAAVEPDVVVCAGYKWLLCPYSTSFQWTHPRWHDAPPLEQHWIGRAHSERFAELVNYRDEYQPGARRFDVGERSNFALVPMALRALQLLQEWGVETIGKRLAALTDRLTDGARALGLGVPERNQRGPHLLGIGLPGRTPEALLAALQEQRIFVSQRGSSLRVSPHVYNDEEDVDRLLEALERHAL